MHPLLTTALAAAGLLALAVVVGRLLRRLTAALRRRPPAPTCPHTRPVRNGFGVRLCLACRRLLPEPDGGEPACGPEGCALPVAHRAGCIHTIAKGN